MTEATCSPHRDHVRTRPNTIPGWHGTTILAVRKDGKTVIAGDGQVSMGQTIVKGNARKVRRLAGGKVVAGFAGATADAFTLIERLEAKLEAVSRAARPRLRRAGQGLAHRPLPAPAGGHADRRPTPTRSSPSPASGDVLEPENGVAAIGSGGNFALAAARALVEFDLDAEEIARRAMGIAADICVYTNRSLTLETIEG